MGDPEMDQQQDMIPAHVLKFFNEVNTYIDVLPIDFRQKLTTYMRLLAWQITEDLHEENPDEYFDAIKARFSYVRNRILH